MYEPEVFRKQMYCIDESTCDIVGIFRRPPQSFDAPIVTRRPGNYALLAPHSHAHAYGQHNHRNANIKLCGKLFISEYDIRHVKLNFCKVLSFLTV